MFYHFTKCVWSKTLILIIEIKKKKKKQPIIYLCDFEF